MNIADITSGISGDIGREILFYETTGSTNSVASDFSERAAEGVVILADAQERGKGRLGRTWVSPPGVNIYMSIILKPALEARDATLLTLMTAIACATALRRATALAVTIKWPNDLIVSDRKLGGILTEIKTESNTIISAVIGIGINVNMDIDTVPDEIREIATSVREETGEVFSRERLITEILNEMNIWYKILIDMKKDTIISEWKRLTSTLGRDVIIKTGQETCTGLAWDIDDEGRLLLKLPSGRIKKISSGDLKVLP